MNTYAYFKENPQLAFKYIQTTWPVYATTELYLPESN